MHMNKSRNYSNLDSEETKSLLKKNVLCKVSKNVFNIFDALILGRSNKRRFNLIYLTEIALKMVKG